MIEIEGYFKAKAVPVEVDGSNVWMQLGTTKNGKEFCRVVLEFIDGPAVGEHMAWDGYLSTLEGENRTIQALRIMGWNGQDILAAQFEPLTSVVTAVVRKDKPQEGRENDPPRFRIAFINDPRGGGQWRVKDDNRIKGADAQRFAKRVNATAAKVPAIKPAAEREPGVDDLDEQLAF